MSNHVLSPSQVTADRVTADSVMDRSSRNLPSNRPLKSLKILLVEDTPINRTVALNQLKHIGYKADYVTNGQEALDKLASESYDLIFMDCQMPVLDGYQATRTLRERERDRDRTLIIGLTAYALKGDREKCLAAGMDDYLTKPVTMKQLADTIAKWVSKKESLKESLIDLQRLADISLGDKKFELILIDFFIEQCQSYLEQLKDALRNSDPELLRRIAHQIKGSSVNVGIKKMPDLAKQLQQAGESNDLKTAANLISELINLLPQLQAERSRWKVPQYQGLKGSNAANSHQLVTGDYLDPELWIDLAKPKSANPEFLKQQNDRPEEDSIIDPDRLAEISHGDETFIHTLIDAFVNNSQTYLEDAKAALAAQDLETLANRVHQIKGSSATVGVRFIPEIAASLHQQVKQNQLNHASELLQQLTELLEQVKHWQGNG